MDKGIRVNVRNKFVELSPQREALGNTPFRKAIIAYAMEEFGITLASAATHYNDAFKKVKQTNPELVLGLGRAEDKKGGRKPKVKAAATAPAAAAAAAATTETVAAEVIAAIETLPAAPVLYTVYKKVDGSVVAEGLNFFDAMLLVEKAKKAKKAALAYK